MWQLSRNEQYLSVDCLILAGNPGKTAVNTIICRNASIQLVNQGKQRSGLYTGIYGPELDHAESH